MCWRASVKRNTGNNPTVVPPLGSVATSGRGMKGEVRGSNQSARVCRGGDASACRGIVSSSRSSHTLPLHDHFIISPTRFTFSDDLVVSSIIDDGNPIEQRYVEGARAGAW